MVELSEVRAEVQKSAGEFSHGIDLFIANFNVCVQFLDMDDMEIFPDLVDFKKMQYVQLISPLLFAY